MLINELYSSATAEVAQTTNNSGINLDGARGYFLESDITVTTPSPLTFADSNVTVATDTIAIAAHGYKTGLKVQLNTTGTLPAGLALATDYFVIVVTSGTIKLASSLILANAGTAVDITAAAGGGTHTVTATAIAGCTVKLQCSYDDSTYVDIASSSVTITVTANSVWNVDAPYYKYVRVVHTLTAGQISCVDKLIVKGNVA